jgi:hypothetical protein
LKAADFAPSTAKPFLVNAMVDEPVSAASAMLTLDMRPSKCNPPVADDEELLVLRGFASSKMICDFLRYIDRRFRRFFQYSESLTTSPVSSSSMSSSLTYIRIGNLAVSISTGSLNFAMIELTSSSFFNLNGHICNEWSESKDGAGVPIANRPR